MNPISIGIGDIASILQGLRAVHSAFQARKDNAAALYLILNRSTILYEVLAKAPGGTVTHQRAVQHLYEALASVKRATDEFKAASPLKRFLFAVDYKDVLTVAANQISAVAGDLNLSLAVRQANKYDSTVADVQAAIMCQLQQVLDERSESLFHQLDLHVRDVPEALAALNQRLEKSEARANQLEQLLYETLLHIRTSVVRHSAAQQPKPSADAKALDRLAVTSYDFDYADPKTTPVLGKGSFGEVVRAVWKATGTEVAIKRLIPFQGSSMAKDQTAANLVAKEALVWSRLQHPHVLPLLGVCLLANVPFLVMPLMASGDLPSFTKGKPALDQLRALHEAAQGVAYLHNQKIFHGDLKGNNVLVDEYGRVQVSDFGQSRVLSMAGSKASTFGSGSVGNVRWIAPERYDHGAEYQFEPDVFGFAMVMYEVLSGGKIPFQDDWRATDDVIREWYRQGVRPTQPTGCLEKFGCVNAWELVEECWQKAWSKRPTMVMVVRKLAMLAAAAVTLPSAPVAIPPSCSAASPSPPVSRDISSFTTAGHVTPLEPPPAYDDDHALLRADSGVANVFTPTPAPSPAALTDSLAPISLDASSPTSPRTLTSPPRPIPEGLFNVPSTLSDSHSFFPDSYPFSPVITTLAVAMDPPLPKTHISPSPSVAPAPRPALHRMPTFDTIAPMIGDNNPLDGSQPTGPQVSLNPSVPAPVVCIVRAKFAYKATIPEEITFAEGEHLAVLEQHPDGWWVAESNRDPSMPGVTMRGLIPSNYVEVVWEQAAES